MLVAVAATIWLAGDVAWSVGLWLARRDLASAHPAARTVSIAIAIMMLAAAWRAPTGTAGVVPPAHRVIASGDRAEIAANPALSFFSMVEAVRPQSTSYTVRSGDCLWKIAQSMIIADGAEPTGETIAKLWRTIYDVNTDVIGADPRLIFPGQVLEIPER